MKDKIFPGHHAEEIVNELLMEAAGIPQDARLVACPDKETATINITRAPFDADLREIPRELLEKLSADGICMGELAEKFAEGAVVYGG